MKNQLTLNYPAAWWGAKWRDALPAGNGVIGAAVYGAVHNETVLLTHDNLWHEVATPELPDVSKNLARTRRLLLENKAAKADQVLPAAFAKARYRADIGAPLPLGDLKVGMPVRAGFSRYRRVLDMSTGEITVQWQDAGSKYTRKLFVSRADDCVVMELCVVGRSPLAADITLDLHDRADACIPGGNDPRLPGNLAVEARADGLIRYAARNDDGTDFGAVARVTSFGGKVTVLDGGVHIQGGSRALVVIKVFAQGRRRKDWERLAKDLSTVTQDYPALFARHAALHGELFKRVSLDLGANRSTRSWSNEELLLDAYQGSVSAAMVEKMWAYGRYLLISSSRAGGQPCPLQGKWCGSYRGYWTFNMANENLQMNYWQALSGNLPETMLPVFEYFDRRIDDFRENARKLYGCRGILVPAITTPPSGLIKDIQPHILHWTGAAAWIGQHYYDYFLHTNDVEFLRTRALPFLREVALFYEDFFTVGTDGFYVSSPSNSPENVPGNHAAGARPLVGMETTMNATMDFALAREVLTHLVDGTAIAGGSDDEINRWQSMLRKVPPYEVTDDGAIKEWLHPFFTDNDRHRHLSHLYPVFPGWEVTRESDPRLFKAFATAFGKRRRAGLGAQTGWSLVHCANVHARMNEGDRALACLALLARSCVMNNFYTTHNDWRNSGIGMEFAPTPYQIDANMGWSAAVQEMLLTSVPGRITILPALPRTWRSGSVKGLRARGGIEVSIKWSEGGRRCAVALCSLDRSQTVGLLQGRRSQGRILLLAGKTKRLTFIHPKP